jgi:hypothetical protein
MQSLKTALLLAFACCALALPNCETAPSPVQPHGNLSTAHPIPFQITDLSCWIEQGQFFATGICINQSPTWQKIWLEATPINIGVQSAPCPQTRIPTFSDAVPPQGRSAFFAHWPLTSPTIAPDSLLITNALAQTQAPRAIMVVENLSGLRVMTPADGTRPASETAYQVSGILFNALPTAVTSVKIEILIFDSEGRLCFSSLLDPQNEQTKRLFQFEKAGPLQPNEKRAFGLQIYYDQLPQSLKQKKIGRVEILAFQSN